MRFRCLLADDNEAVSLAENHLKYLEGLTKHPLLPPCLCVQSHKAGTRVRVSTGSRKAAAGSEDSPPHPSLSAAVIVTHPPDLRIHVAEWLSSSWTVVSKGWMGTGVQELIKLQLWSHRIKVHLGWKRPLL